MKFCYSSLIDLRLNTEEDWKSFLQGLSFEDVVSVSVEIIGQFKAIWEENQVLQKHTQQPNKHSVGCQTELGKLSSLEYLAPGANSDIYCEGNEEAGVSFSLVNPDELQMSNTTTDQNKPLNNGTSGNDVFSLAANDLILVNVEPVQEQVCPKLVTDKNNNINCFGFQCRAFEQSSIFDLKAQQKDSSEQTVSQNQERNGGPMIQYMYVIKVSLSVFPTKFLHYV